MNFTFLRARTAEIFRIYGTTWLIKDPANDTNTTHHIRTSGYLKTVLKKEKSYIIYLRGGISGQMFQVSRKQGKASPPSVT